MNIAIIIGVSEYEVLNNLPSCKNDAVIINNILTHSSKYEEVLFIDNKTTSQNIKSNVIDFIQKYRGKEIEEFFIYFSGHGYFDGKEFYYLCSNFNKERLKQTSFENIELDSYIKLLNPKLTIKVIDSCQSGVQYIKDANSFQDYIQKDQNSFNNCYFLYSSQNNQSSYANEDISYFTKELVESLINMDIDNIRYKDIIDYISDSFASNQDQKPFFVIQADLTEEFISIDKSFKTELQEKLDSKELVLEDEKNKQTLLEIVKEDSKKYFEKDNVIKILNDIQKQVQSYDFTKDNLNELYKSEITIHKDYNNIPRIETIAQWAKKNKKDFFIDIIYKTKTVKRKVLKHEATSIVASLAAFNGDKYEMKNVDIQYPSKVHSSTELEYNYIFIKNYPIHPNLHSTAFAIIPFISKTKILFFTTPMTYNNVGWSEEELDTESIEWLETQLDLENIKKITEFIDEVIESFITFTINEVKRVVGATE